ncbi:hypothetical [Prochlorococcus marinus str. MIT 9313]|uniref:Uncharacterized protein n=1 Tax=Prochlorococcus marinus (strain MIT 9313) TaxID=74547 RepID=Q7V7U6_PROMM|nr:hypothetical [Prochlorococcus marinus str. MIT 9313]
MLCCDSQSQWLSSMWRGECQCRLAANHYFDWLFGCIGLAWLHQGFQPQACRCDLETFCDRGCWLNGRLGVAESLTMSTKSRL